MPYVVGEGALESQDDNSRTDMNLSHPYIKPDPDSEATTKEDSSCKWTERGPDGTEEGTEWTEKGTEWTEKGTEWAGNSDYGGKDHMMYLSNFPAMHRKIESLSDRTIRSFAEPQVYKNSVIDSSRDKATDISPLCSTRNFPEIKIEPDTEGREDAGMAQKFETGPSKQETVADIKQEIISDEEMPGGDKASRQDGIAEQRRMVETISKDYGGVSFSAQTGNEENSMDLEPESETPEKEGNCISLPTLPKLETESFPHGVIDSKSTNDTNKQDIVKGTLFNNKRDVNNDSAEGAPGFLAEVPNTDDQSKNEKKFPCKECGKSFAGKTQLRIHGRVHTGEKPYSCTFCEKKFSAHSSLKRHERIHTGEKPYTCEICNRSFTTAGNMAQHRKTHTGEKPYPCPECGKCFTQSSSVKLHMKTHTGEKPYVCYVCDKGFITLADLNKHIRIHSGEKPFICDICGNGFAQAGSLTSHKRSIHSEEKPFQCSQCDKCFKSNQHLKLHFMSHTGEKPYECQDCGKCFKTSGDLKIHNRYHTGERPYVCSICTKAFSTGDHLNSHMRSHTGERPYKCTYCDKAFSTASNLSTHTRTHTGEKPFVCNVCNKAFAQAVQLRRHYSVHESFDEICANYNAPGSSVRVEPGPSGQGESGQHQRVEQSGQHRTNENQDTARSLTLATSQTDRAQSVLDYQLAATQNDNVQSFMDHQQSPMSFPTNELGNTHVNAVTSQQSSVFPYYYTN